MIDLDALERLARDALLHPGISSATGQYAYQTPSRVIALVAELRAAREELQRPAEERAARTMVYAQRFADQILDEAKVKAKAMVAEAETRAKHIVEVAQERAFEIAREAR